MGPSGADAIFLFSTYGAYTIHGGAAVGEGTPQKNSLPYPSVESKVFVPGRWAVSYRGGRFSMCPVSPCFSSFAAILGDLRVSIGRSAGMV